MPLQKKIIVPNGNSEQAFKTAIVELFTFARMDVKITLRIVTDPIFRMLQDDGVVLQSKVCNSLRAAGWVRFGGGSCFGLWLPMTAFGFLFV